MTQEQLDPNASAARKSGYILWSLLHGTLSPERLTMAFLGDSHLARFFPDQDAALVDWLLLHGKPDTIAKREAMLEQLGSAAQARIAQLNRSVPDVTVPSDDDLGAWVTEIQEHWQRDEGERKLAVYQAALRDPNSDPVLVLGQASADIGSIGSLAAVGRYQTARDAGKGARLILHGTTGRAPSNCIETCFYKLNEHYDGFERGKIAAVGGIPGSGKTTLVEQMTTAMAASGLVVVWLHEIGAGDMLFRDALREAHTYDRYQLRQLRKPIRGYQEQLDTETRADKRAYYEARIAEEIEKQDADPLYVAIEEQIDYLSTLPIVYEPCAEHNAITLKVLLDQVRAQYGRVDAVVIDHIQLFQSIEKAEQAYSVRQRYQEVRRYALNNGYENTAFIAIQHLNKDIKAQAGAVIPEQEDFAYGGHQEIDTGLIVVRQAQHLRQLGYTLDEIKRLKRETPEKWAALKREAYLWIVKARNGEGGNNIAMDFEGNYYKWSEVSDHGK